MTILKNHRFLFKTTVVFKNLYFNHKSLQIAKNEASIPGLCIRIWGGQALGTGQVVEKITIFT